MNYINVVDARYFEDRQAIRLSDNFDDCHVTGASFSPDSSRIFACTCIPAVYTKLSFYLALEDTIFEYSVDTLRRRTFSTRSLV